MRFAAQNIYAKGSEALKQNSELIFIQVPTFKHFEIHLLKALVELYGYTIAIMYHIVQCTE